MSGPGLSLFILGATGYIGGAVAAAIQKGYPSAILVAFTRSEGKAPALKTLGLEPLIGSGNTEKDYCLIKDAVKRADVVINCTDADDLSLTKIILNGLEVSHSKNPIYIHTSGTGVVCDKPIGSFQDSAKKIWDDNNVEDIKAIRPSQPHREVDLTIFEASTKGHSINYIIAPSTIYGVGTENPAHKLSQQIPYLIRLAIQRKQAVYGGDGTNLWNNVHIHDLTELYLIVLDKALVERSTGTFSTAVSDPYERFYWGSVATHQWGNVVREIASILFKGGLVNSDTAISVPVSEVSAAVTTNSRTVANRGFKEGWKPYHPSLENTLEEDVNGVLEEDGFTK